MVHEKLKFSHPTKLMILYTRLHVVVVCGRSVVAPEQDSHTRSSLVQDISAA